MENKNAAILVLAILAAVVITASATYAMMGKQAGGTGVPNPGATLGYGMGQSMMGGYSGSYGMMGGHWMMGAYGNHYGMYQYMRQYWNSTSAP